MPTNQNKPCMLRMQYIIFTCDFYNMTYNNILYTPTLRNMHIEPFCIAYDQYIYTPQQNIYIYSLHIKAYNHCLIYIYIYIEQNILGIHEMCAYAMLRTDICIYTRVQQFHSGCVHNALQAYDWCLMSSSSCAWIWTCVVAWLELVLGNLSYTYACASTFLYMSTSPHFVLMHTQL
jgi:hypothetical protein